MENESYTIVGYNEIPDTDIRNNAALLNADLEELEACLEKKSLRYARQQERLERLQQSLKNTQEDIRVLKMILRYVEIYHCMGQNRGFIPHKDIFRFFMRASEVYDELCHRLHCHINYKYFCRAIHLCYHLDSRVRRNGHDNLSVFTVLGYFKREREE